MQSLHILYIFVWQEVNKHTFPAEMGVCLTSAIQKYMKCANFAWPSYPYFTMFQYQTSQFYSFRGALSNRSDEFFFRPLN